MEEKEVFDVLIVGGGVAGMSSALYAKRAGKKVAIIEKFALGGQVLSLAEIENFPSQSKIDGVTLVQMFKKQIKELGVSVLFDEVKGVKLDKKPFELKGAKKSYFANNVIFATGISYKTLGIGEEKLLGRGVSYCAVCDGNFYKNKCVAVVSRKGSGVKDALYLSKIAKEVLLLDEEDMSIYASANKNEKLKVLSNCKVVSLDEKESFGQKVLGGVSVEISKSLGEKERGLNSTASVKEKRVLEVDALFVSIGKEVDASAWGGSLKVDAKGYVVTDEAMQTSIQGVFAIGDVRNGVLKQIVTACSDGAIAGNNC